MTPRPVFFRKLSNHLLNLLALGSICVALGGMVAGILAGNADVTDLFIDGTRKIFGYDKADMALFLADLEKFIADLEKVIRDANVNVTITVSVDPADLPENLKKYL